MTEDRVTARRLAAIAVIFIGTTIGWSVLALSVTGRSGSLDDRLEKDVERLWGAPQRQVAPSAWMARPFVTEAGATDWRGVPVSLESTEASVDLALEHRQRGLLWYPTYEVRFKGTYTFRNPDAEPRELRIRLPLPAKDALYDDFVFSINGEPSAPVWGAATELTQATIVAPGATATLDAQYRSRGLRTWTYALADDGAAQVRNFHLTLHANFDDIDFPAGTMSPAQKTPSTNGWTLDWRFSNLISGQSLGLQLPQKLNPGPFAAAHVSWESVFGGVREPLSAALKEQAHAGHN
jgi:hypothetical protein